MDFSGTPVLRLMTLNTLFKPPTEQRWKELAAWIAAEGPDIVCLQECRREDGRDVSRWLASSLPDAWFVAFAALGAGFMAAAPILRVLLDRAQPRYLLTATLTGTAVSYWLLFHAASLATALPAAVAVGMTGSMCLVIPQTTVQRVIPNAALGRINAVFLTGEAAATLIGAVGGPVLTQAIGLGGIAAVASLTTAVAAALTVLLLSATIPLPGKPVPDPAP